MLVWSLALHLCCPPGVLLGLQQASALQQHPQSVCGAAAAQPGQQASLRLLLQSHMLQALV